MQADSPQQPRDRVAKLGIVIDNQHAWGLVTHPGSCIEGSAYPSFYVQSGDMNSACCLRRIAECLSHRLGSRALLCGHPCLTLQVACGREVLRRRYGGREKGAWKPQC